MNSVRVTVKGIPYTYECHTFHHAAEVLAGTLAVIEENGGGYTIDSFEIF